jgi:WD40 repeat protein
MMRRIAVFLAATTFVLGVLPARAQGTRLWTQSRYEEFEHGTADGVAIRNDGRLEVAPAKKLLYTTSGNFVWSIATDAAGNAFLGRGGTTSNSAIVTMVKADGSATDIFAGKEMAVQALKPSPDGTLFAATSPDGKVYRIDYPKAGATAKVIFDPAATSEKPKYIWDLAMGKSGEVYVATGAPAVVYKIAPGASKPIVLFKTLDQHIRCLLLGPDGTLFAGSDGAGVIYKIDTTKSNPTPFALYSASRREITSLALDGTGTLYAAGVGSRGSIPLPNLPVAGAPGITLTFVQPGSSTAATSSTVIPEGSEIYKIAPDGSPSKLVTLKDDVVYALTPLSLDAGPISPISMPRRRWPLLPRLAVCWLPPATAVEPSCSPTQRRPMRPIRVPSSTRRSSLIGVAPKYCQQHLRAVIWTFTSAVATSKTRF